MNITRQQTKQIIADFLNGQNLDLTPVAGGVVSNVSCWTNDSNPLVFKQTKEFNPKLDISRLPFHPRDLERLLKPAPDTHDLDLIILKNLNQIDSVLVPTVIGYNLEHNITLMQDFRGQGYEMLQNLLVAEDLTTQVGSEIGTALAKLVAAMKKLAKNQDISPIESSQTQFEERLEEIRVVLGYDPEFKPRIDQIYHQALADQSELILTDTHPKNIAYNSDAKQSVMFYDFGRTIYGDPQFTAPNFAAHIGLAILGGCFKLDTGIEFLEKFVEAYNHTAEQTTNVERIDQAKFNEYFIGEVLHRGLGARWINPKIFTPSKNLNQTEIKDSVGVAIQVMAKKLLRQKREELSTKKLFELLAETRSQIKSGKFVLAE